jgi:hypothetical protein
VELIGVVGPVAYGLLVVLQLHAYCHRDRLALRWQQIQERRRERARFLRLAKEKQARRKQRERELTTAGHSRLLYLVRLLMLVLEPGERSDSALRHWLFSRTEQVQVAEPIISRSVQQHRARGEILQARRDRAEYRDRLARGVIARDGADLYSLRGAHLAGIVEVPPVTAKSHRTRHRDRFPVPAHRHGATDYYRPEDLTVFYERHPELLPKPQPLPRLPDLDEDGEDYSFSPDPATLEMLRKASARW